MIASHAEVWTFQFWWKFYQELTFTLIQVPEGTAVSAQGNIMPKRKKVTLTKDALLSSHLAVYVL